MAKPNAVNTRFRKRRDLESTMTTLKQNLTPTLPSKKGTRVKSKPRNLPKKVLPLKIETCPSYGEFYPDKLKRKKTEKAFLKPKHDYKVVVSTNKRKRRTPHKGLISFDDELPTILTNPPSADAQNPLTTQQDITSIQEIQALKPEKSGKSLLKVQTCRSLEMVNYKLISPPHKSLTDLTAEDLMRMDNDSLSDEDMMEILTCPSPVWWEEPCDNYKEGDLYLFEAYKNSTVNPTSDEKLKDTNKNVFYASSCNLEINLSTNVNSVRKMMTKTKKAKLENILGQIKNKIHNYHHINDDRLEVNSNPKDFANDQHNEEMKKIDDNKANKTKNSVDGQDVCKPRKLSSSCSDTSVNEEDLLRNLESIDIPIQIISDVSKDDENDVVNNDKVFGKKSRVIKGLFIQGYQGVYDTSNESARKRKRGKSAKRSCQNKRANTVKSNETKNKKADSKRMKKGGQKDTPSKSTNKIEVMKVTPAYKDILKRLKPQTDDILDVRLIKTPTKINEIKVWSKLDNFKRHSYKPEYFNDVVDVEDELAFSMIISPVSKQDPLDISKPNTETILIEDDDSDNDIDKATVEEIVNDTETNKTNNEVPLNSTKATHPGENMMDINGENIIKEDTIKIGNNLDVRLIETSPETNIIKNKDEVNMIVKDPLKTYTIAHGHAKIGLLKLLPLKTLKKTLSATDEITCINSTTEIDSDATSKAYSEHKATLKKPEQNNTYEDEEDALTNVGVTVKNLPVLIQNPTLDSPKSTKSFISVGSDSISIENSEGTISDTNIKFIDDYEGRIEYIDEESQSSQMYKMKEQKFVTDTKSLNEDRENVQIEKNNKLHQDKAADTIVNTQNDDKISDKLNNDHKNEGKSVNTDNNDPDKDNVNEMTDADICDKKCADKAIPQKEVKENRQNEFIAVNKEKTVIKTYSKKAVT